MHDLGPAQVLIELSGHANLRVSWTPSGIHIGLVTPEPIQQNPNVILELLELEPRHVELRTAVRRLSAINNLYVIARLLLAERHELLTRALLTVDSEDLGLLLTDDEKVYLESLFSGSWYVTIWSKAKDNYEIIIGVIAAVFPRVREAMIRKIESQNELIEAQTRLTNAQARRAEAEAADKELDVEGKLLDLKVAKIEQVMNLAKRVPDRDVKARLYRITRREISNLLGDQSSDAAVDAATTRLLGSDNQ